ncbi:DUF6502 family protein [Derxia gummosa]|uniref:DUF6502 family protein n=1 Tax=Derxia gummosa DSM 723 TaxID=1121388 RepID=A0A8B6XAV5_9BURK|nr:DUF6502 family protein [Derxia gummosa]
METNPGNESDWARPVLAELLRPLAELALSQGLKLQELTEALKVALVDAAAAEIRNTKGPKARVTESALSVATGVHRKDVHRLLAEAESPVARPPRSVAPLVFTRWRSSPEFLDAEGNPRALPANLQTEQRPNFAQLCASISQDVHPRTVLDELMRLDLVAEEDGWLRLTRVGFVPSGETRALIDFVGANVGDHFLAAVRNVRAPEPVHFEQAVWAAPVDRAAVEAARALAREQWPLMLKRLVPMLEAAEARATGSDDALRLRLGLYMFHEAAPQQAAGARPDAPANNDNGEAP